MTEAYVTLATNDSYAFGAATLASSLRRTGTTRAIVCMVTTGVSPLMRLCLERFFDELVFVDVFDSNDTANLALLGRPELGCTFTKLSCWRLTSYTKAVFLDADTLVLANIDDLFERDELSAAPDLGWPDCFNSGVFVFSPCQDTYERLVDFALTTGSFDGGDQGLLNSFFSDWSFSDIKRHLPYVYNAAFMAAPYSYLPALKHFFKNLKVVHFLGALKPWLFPTDSKGQPLIPPNLSLHDCSRKLINAWWDIYNSSVKSRLSEGISPASQGVSLHGVAPTHGQGEGLSVEEQDALHRAAWESGYVEYGGRDSFQNIQSHLDSVMAQTAQPQVQQRPASASTQKAATAPAVPKPAAPQPTVAPPTKTAPAQPMKTAPAQPMKTAPAQPMKTAPAQPMKAAPAPIKSAMAKPSAAKKK